MGRDIYICLFQGASGIGSGLCCASRSGRSEPPRSGDVIRWRDEVCGCERHAASGEMRSSSRRRRRRLRRLRGGARPLSRLSSTTSPTTAASSGSLPICRGLTEHGCPSPSMSYALSPPGASALRDEQLVTWLIGSHTTGRLVDGTPPRASRTNPYTSDTP